MSRLIKLLSVAITIIFFITGCGTTKDPAEAYRGEAPEHIYQKGLKALRDGSYQEALKRFEALDVQYPYGPYTEKAQLYLIYAYYMTNDYASAEAAADRFIHTHPTNPHVDYAFYMRGLSNYYQNLGVFERLFAIDLAKRDLVQIKKSYMDFSELTRTFPNSEYTPAAHQYMTYLRNILADHELHIAEYYFSRNAFVAAANRASLVVRHYQGSPAVPKALDIMAKSYHALHLNQNEQEVLEVIRYNYPNSEAVQR